MTEGVTATMPLGQRITLHRTPSGNKNEQIQENLECLKINMHSKKLAQKYYYENSERSPLLREHITLNRKPVHERLGVNLRRKHAYNFQPNMRNKNRVMNNTINLRKNTAQARIQRIRQSPNVMRHPTLIPKLRLHRNVPSQPINYKILVKNENACQLEEECGDKHSVLGSLTESLQQDIKILQVQNIAERIIPDVSIVTERYGCTGVSMNTRFSLLP